jgi:type II secretory pathway component PulF
MASLQELQALNTEMASLARVGVPLELGLSHLSRTLPRRLGSLAGRIASRLQEGRSLVEALHLEGRAVSPTYVAVVEAALEANRLPAALDALAEYGAVVQDMRRRVTLALLYPGIVAVFAYVLFVFFILKVTPTIIATLELSPSNVIPLMQFLEMLWQSSSVWVPLAPIAIILLLTFVSRVLSAAANVRVDSGGGFLNGTWFPGVTGLYADLDRSQSAGLLGLLVDHGIPLPRALRLTAAATRSSRLSGICGRLATGIEQGQSLRTLIEQEDHLAPLIARLFAAGEQEGRLGAALAQAATIYRRRAMRRADWLRTILPPVLVTVVGGGITLLYALTLFLPLRSLWMGL